MGRLKGEEEEGATAEKGRGIEGDGNTDATGWPTGCVCLTYSAWLYAGMLSGTGNVEEAREASRVPARGKMAQDSAGGVGVLKLRTGSMMKASSHANCKPCAAVNPLPSLPLSPSHRRALPTDTHALPVSGHSATALGWPQTVAFRDAGRFSSRPPLAFSSLCWHACKPTRAEAKLPSPGGVSSAGQQLSTLAGGTIKQT